MKPGLFATQANLKRWPAPLYNLYFDSFLLICTSFVVKTRGIVCVVYPLSRLANYRDPCKRCVLAQLEVVTDKLVVKFMHA